MDRQSLIAALEQAEVGSRELDAEIAVLDKPGMVPNYPTDKGRVIGWFWDGADLTSQTAAPHYTTDLDAALPGENIIHTVYRGFVPHPERIEQWEAAHAVIEDGKMVECLWGRAKTEPLARRIACLKATQP